MEPVHASLLEVDVTVESPAFAALGDVEALVHRAAAAVAAAEALPGPAEAVVLLGDDATVRRLNAEFRGKNQPTNVLAFPAVEGPATGPRFLGDVAVAFETTAREAQVEGKPVTHHVTHLVVHGLLHLLGYDHGTEAEARVMEDRERAILATLGVPDPYSDQDEAA